MSLPGWARVAPTFTDGVISLRPWEPTDAAAVLGACQDPDIQHWLPVPVPYLSEHAEGFVREFAPQQWSTEDGAPFAAVDSGTGRLLGLFGLKSIDFTRNTAELGYWVAPRARGRKVAQRGVRLLSDWSFNEVGLRRLAFLVEPANVASCAVVERTGAVVEEFLPGMLVIQGTPRDTARYVLQRP